VTIEEFVGEVAKINGWYLSSGMIRRRYRDCVLCPIEMVVAVIDERLHGLPVYSFNECYCLYNTVFSCAKQLQLTNWQTVKIMAASDGDTRHPVFDYKLRMSLIEATCINVPHEFPLE
jgi:hypothetical protein